jgi:hypothetical protein
MTRSLTDADILRALPVHTDIGRSIREFWHDLEEVYPNRLIQPEADIAAVLDREAADEPAPRVIRRVTPLGVTYARTRGDIPETYRERLLQARGYLMCALELLPHPNDTMYLRDAIRDIEAELGYQMRASR